MSSCCGGSSRKNVAAFGVVMLLLVMGVVLLGRAAIKPLVFVETVDIVVATKDMTTGTAFTKDNVHLFTEVRKFPKSQINPEAKFITDQKEMIGKRLTRAIHADEFFNVSDVHPRTVIMFEAGKDIMSLPVNAAKLPDGFFGSGSRIDIHANHGEGPDKGTFLLLPDMGVLSVNGESDLKKSPDPQKMYASFCVDEKQVKLITLANQAGCALDFVVRSTETPPPKFDYDATLAHVQALRDGRIAPLPRAVER